MKKLYLTLTIILLFPTTAFTQVPAAPGVPTLVFDAQGLEEATRMFDKIVDTYEATQKMQEAIEAIRTAETPAAVLSGLAGISESGFALTANANFFSKLNGATEGFLSEDQVTCLSTVNNNIASANRNAKSFSSVSSLGQGFGRDANVVTPFKSVSTTSRSLTRTSDNALARQAKAQVLTKEKCGDDVPDEIKDRKVVVPHGQQYHFSEEELARDDVIVLKRTEVYADTRDTNDEDKAYILDYTNKKDRQRDNNLQNKRNVLRIAEENQNKEIIASILKRADRQQQTMNTLANDLPNDAGSQIQWIRQSDLVKMQQNQMIIELLLDIKTQQAAFISSQYEENADDTNLKLFVWRCSQGGAFVRNLERELADDAFCKEQGIHH